MENKILTICVCSLLERSNTFLPKILKQLQEQLVKYPNSVELIVDIDNRSKSLGKKRNENLQRAQGKYITFVDDDDILADDYVDTIIEVINNNDVDSISFIVDVSINDGPFKPCYYSYKYGKDYNCDNSYHRLPNHICVLRTELAKEVGFNDITFGEDADFSKRLFPFIKSELMIDKKLYKYNYNVRTTTTRNTKR